MALVKTSISIPEDILKQAKDLSDNFSSLVTEALKDYLRKKTVEKALQSFGKWGNRDKDSRDIVNEMRIEAGRDYANRLD